MSLSFLPFWNIQGRWLLATSRACWSCIFSEWEWDYLVLTALKDHLALLVTVFVKRKRREAHWMDGKKRNPGLPALLKEYRSFSFSLPFSFLFFFLLRQGLCSPGWPQTCDPPASTSQELELETCTTMPSKRKKVKKWERDRQRDRERKEVEKIIQGGERLLPSFTEFHKNPYL
jgi:hypothetical protein